MGAGRVRKVPWVVMGSDVGGTGSVGIVPGATVGSERDGTGRVGCNKVYIP